MLIKSIRELTGPRAIVAGGERRRGVTAMGGEGRSTDGRSEKSHGRLGEKGKPEYVDPLTSANTHTHMRVNTVGRRLNCVYCLWGGGEVRAPHPETDHMMADHCRASLPLHAFSVRLMASRGIYPSVQMNHLKVNYALA